MSQLDINKSREKMQRTASSHLQGQTVIQTHNMQTAQSDRRYKNTPAEMSFKLSPLSTHLSIYLIKSHFLCAENALHLKVTRMQIISLLQILHINLNLACFGQSAYEELVRIFFFTELLYFLVTRHFTVCSSPAALTSSYRELLCKIWAP